MLPKQFVSEKRCFEHCQKSLYIWAIFVTKIFTRNFVKSPNLVTLVVVDKNARLLSLPEPKELAI